MKEICIPANHLEDYLKMWFTEAKVEWEGYKNCCTKWQHLQETACLAEDHFYNFKKWTSRLMAYEEWADTNTQPQSGDTITLEVYDASTEDSIEWLLRNTYLYPSANDYLAHYWTGLQRRD